MNFLRTISLISIFFMTTFAFASCGECQHENSEWHTVIEATCVQEGMRQKLCSDCQAIIKIDKLIKLEHTPGEAIVENEFVATCTTEGSYDSAVCCYECGVEISRETIIVTACGHDYLNGACTRCGEADESFGFTFALLGDGTYSLTDYNGSATNIVIPSTYNGKAVTTIGASAFYKCSNLTSIEIPDSVTSIGADAFFCCKSLTSITVSNDNTAYKSIDGNLYTKDGETLIQYAIGKTDTSFTIPDSVTSIGSWAFGCSSLTSIVIPHSVKSIGYHAFSECYSLSNIVIGDSVKSIGIGAFACCYSLTSVTIPNSVKSIGNYAFYECTSLTSVTIPDSVTSIGDGAFNYCNHLTSVIIGSGVTSIGFQAFAFCYRLTSIEYRGTEEQWNAISIPKGDDWDYNSGNITYEDGNVGEWYPII